MSGAHYTIRVPKRALKGTLLGLLALAVAAFLCRRMILAAAGDWLEVRVPCKHADVIVVLAGDAGGDRLSHAVRLFKQGIAAKLLITGGPTAEVTEIMKQQALKQGVPEGDIWMQTRSHSTTEDARFSLDLLEGKGVGSICLVTSNYHSRRTLAAFLKRRKPGLQVYMEPVDPDWWRERPWWDQDLGRLLVLSEYTKMAWGWLFGSEF